VDDYIAVVFETDGSAAEGLHALWHLDDLGKITVHGAAVVRRNALGHIDVATKQTDPGVRTAFGVAIGALLGALAGPVGAAAGASVAAGTAAGIGAAAGGVAGMTADIVKSGEHEQAAYDTGFVLKSGQSAVVAEVSEEWATPVDFEMARLGGVVYRRPQDVVRDESLDQNYHPYYLYPYDYEPSFAS